MRLCESWMRENRTSSLSGGRRPALRRASSDPIVIVGAVGPQDVQPLAAAADADVISLADQRPAAVEQVQAPDRVAGVHEVATGRRPGRSPRPPRILNELALPLPAPPPEQARDPVVARPHP